MYFYWNHMGGGVYYSEEEIDDDDLYCETCGDSDSPLGNFDNFSEFWDYIKDECSINGSGGYDLKHILSVACEAFDIDAGIDIENSDYDIVLNTIERIDKETKEDEYDKSK